MIPIHREMTFGFYDRNGCEASGIDSEIDLITRFNPQWKAIVAADRSVFSRPLTSNRFHGLLGGLAVFNRALDDGAMAALASLTRSLS